MWLIPVWKRCNNINCMSKFRRLVQGELNRRRPLVYICRHINSTDSTFFASGLQTTRVRQPHLTARWWLEAFPTALHELDKDRIPSSPSSSSLLQIRKCYTYTWQALRRSVVLVQSLVRCHLIECGYSFLLRSFGYSVRFYCVAFGWSKKTTTTNFGCVIFDYCSGRRSPISQLQQESPPGSVANNASVLEFAFRGAVSVNLPILLSSQFRISIRLWRTDGRTSVTWPCGDNGVPSISVPRWPRAGKWFLFWSFR